MLQYFSSLSLFSLLSLCMCISMFCLFEQVVSVNLQSPLRLQRKSC